MRIIKEKDYFPKDIAKHRLIHTTRKDKEGKYTCSYIFVLRQIENGELKAEANGGGKIGYHKIKGSEIIAWRKRHNYFVGEDGETEENGQPVAQ